MRASDDLSLMAFSRLEVNRGDVLVAKTDQIISAETAERLRAILEKRFDALGCTVLVIGPEISISVIGKRPGHIPPRPLPSPAAR